MNALCDKFGDKIAVLGFICNQFGHQSNGSETEFVSILRHVRPGGGFECKQQIELMKKCDVNGSKQLPVFKWLKACQKVPFGPAGDSKGNGVDDNDALTQEDKAVLWAPISRGDIAWNFEKFLVGPDGKFVKRYSRYVKIDDIEPAIAACLELVAPLSLPVSLPEATMAAGSALNAKRALDSAVEPTSAAQPVVPSALAPAPAAPTDAGLLEAPKAAVK